MSNKNNKTARNMNEAIAEAYTKQAANKNGTNRVNNGPVRANGAVRDFDLPPVTKYGGTPKTVIYEYDITSRRVEDAIKDLFAGVDAAIAQNLVVFSAQVSKKFSTITIMFDPKTVRRSQKNKARHDNGNGVLFNYLPDMDQGGSSHIQLRHEVENLLSMICYNSKDRQGMMSKQMCELLAVDPRAMRKFVQETRPFEMKLNGNHHVIAIHVDPIKVFHYMLRDTRNEDTVRDTNYRVLIRHVKDPSGGESIFTVQRKRTTRRTSNGNFDEVIRQRAAESITRKFRTSGF